MAGETEKSNSKLFFFLGKKGKKKKCIATRLWDTSATPNKSLLQKILMRIVNQGLAIVHLGLEVKS